MADNRIAYGLAKRYGIDTTGMEPHEVWEALGKIGVTSKNISDGAYNSQGNKAVALAKKVNEKNTAQKEKQINSERNPKRFAENLTKAKNSVPERDRWRVDIHSAEDYANDKLFTSEKGSCVAVEPNGNIISVCRANEDNIIRGSDLLKKAIDNGGDRLDAFSNLYKFYAKNGFEPVSWTPFNKDFAPEGWNEEKGDKQEPIIFWKYTGKGTELKKEEFLDKIKPSVDYDTAKEIRDRSIEK